jgi:4'-phosphopantetheinyl transferase
MANPTIQIQQLYPINWLNSTSCNYTLSPSSSHVWRIRISQNLSLIDAAMGLLSTDEQERASRYYREKDKQRFIVSRIALRTLLARYLNLNHKEIYFEVGENKKPHVKGNTRLHYNVSHSGDIVLIALSGSAIGVDVENMPSETHYTEIMEISYSKDETDHVNTATNPLQTFYTLWTRKEALLKATAKGIDDDMKFIPCIDGLHNVKAETIGSNDNWMVSSFKVDHDHLGCVATASTDVIFWDF